MQNKKTEIKVALAGNPNSGKTTIFNAITKGTQRVGNYPGVTVEKVFGFTSVGGERVRVVDLPGTYSLTAYSDEEIITRNYITDEKPDVLVNVVDSSNLEPNLYLTTQLMELGVPMVLVFNMSDISRNRGISLDLNRFAELMGVRIVETVGNKKQGVGELIRAIGDVAREGSPPRSSKIKYGSDIEQSIAKISKGLTARDSDLDEKDLRWIAIKLMERDKEVRSKFAESPAIEIADRERERIIAIYKEDPEVLVADHRYGYISGACQESIRSTVEMRHTTSDRIDTVLLHRVLGIPIFLGLMYIMFMVTFALAEPIMEVLENSFEWIGSAVDGLWPVGSESVLRALISEGIIGGVGGVIVFLPNIILLFMFISLLEDTGYMARAAFLMDKLMHKIGLHGKSFIPMLLGFGCSIPAILATRTLENKRDRFTTIMVIPLISCSARLPIYALVIPAFFPQTWRAPMLWLIYFIGVVLAVLLARLLRGTVFRGEGEIFVMELPPYRLPTIKSVGLHMWRNAWLFLKKAGTVILGISVVLWALSTYPRTPEEELKGLSADEQISIQLANTVSGRVGHAMEPVLKTMGFDYRIGTALIGAMAAKEVFVAQLGVIYAVDDGDEDTSTLRERLRNNYSPLVGFCIMLFTLISTPCIATIMATRKETGSWWWAALQFTGLTLLAYIITTTCYQLGSLLGLGV